jgi:hypothetical protein
MWRRLLQSRAWNRDAELDDETVRELLAEYEAELSDELGDYGAAAAINQSTFSMHPSDENFTANEYDSLIRDLAWSHDAVASFPRALSARRRSDLKKFPVNLP